MEVFQSIWMMGRYVMKYCIDVINSLILDKEERFMILDKEKIFMK